MKITVNVTANDIKYSKPMDGLACPIHRSLSRHKVFKGLMFRVGRYNIIADEETDSERYIATLPREAVLFTKEFDGLYGESHRRFAKPFKFELEVDL